MTQYYFDDDCETDHFKTKVLKTDEEAEKWGLELREKYKGKNSIVYKESDSDDKFTIVKEWRTTG